MFSIWKLFSLGKKVKNINGDAQKPKKLQNQHIRKSLIVLTPKITQFYCTSKYSASSFMCALASEGVCLHSAPLVVSLSLLFQPVPEARDTSACQVLLEGISKQICTSVGSGLSPFGKAVEEGKLIDVR